MSTASAHCPDCGAPLPAGGALCAGCLLQRGLEPNTIPPTLPAESWTPPTVEQLAPFFPDLDLLSLLGRGGMGAVYKARQKTLDRIIALKILPPQLAADPSFPQRFTHEAQALAKLNHPHIVTIYDFGTRELPVSSVEFREVASSSLETRTPMRETIFFLSMEFIDGLSLRQLLTASRLEPSTALAIVPQICDALQYAHDRGIVHRDIKPENILLTQAGTIKIADFGLAKLMTGQERAESADDAKIAGTPHYMAPEQCSAPEAVDHRADIYALGVVLYQMLTGELPTGKFDAPSKKVRIDIRLDEIVLRALEKSPDLRYQNATDFKTEIETVVAGPQNPPSARGTSTVSSPIPDPPASQRLSRTALLGALWVPFALLAALFSFVARDEGGPGMTPTIPGYFFVWTLLPLGLTAPLGTTICGILSLSQIRRSHGHLYGLSLALVDALLFPLLALDVFIAFLLFNAAIAFLGWSRTYSDVHNSQLIIATVLISGIVDWLIIFSVWRSLRGSSATPSESPALRGAYTPARPSPSTPNPFEFRSRATFLGLPLLHITGGMDPATGRPRVAHGIIAIGPLARGFLALGGVTFGFFSIGGVSTGIFTCGGFAVGLVSLGGLSLGLLVLASGLGLAATYASAGLAIAPKAFGGLAIGCDTLGGATVPLQPSLAIPLALLITGLLVAALFLAHKICAPSVLSLRRTRLSLTAISALLLAFILLQLPHPMFPTAAQADVHYRVFAAPAALVDELIPPQSRQSAELSDPDAIPKTSYLGSPFTASSQTAAVSDALLDKVFAGALAPGLLVDREHVVDYWPRVADAWSYSFSRGGGGATLSLGIRRNEGQLQLRVEGVVSHDLDSASNVQAQIVWHGNAPAGDNVRLFLIPFTSTSGSPRYLVIAYTCTEAGPIPGVSRGEVFVTPPATSHHEPSLDYKLIPLDNRRTAAKSTSSFVQQPAKSHPPQVASDDDSREPNPAIIGASKLGGEGETSSTTTEPVLPHAVRVIPQAKPLVALIEAVRASDVEAFRAVFVRAIRDDHQPWEEKLEEAKGRITNLFGEMSPAQMRFSYDGDDNQGTLTVHVKDEAPDVMPFQVPVAKEGGSWKLAGH